MFKHAGSDFPCLYGSTCFRENLEDEWLIVYLLFSISRLFNQLVIRSVQIQPHTSEVVTSHMQTTLIIID